jgi:hypothetical protein
MAYFLHPTIIYNAHNIVNFCSLHSKSSSLKSVYNANVMGKNMATKGIKNIYHCKN